MEGEQGWDPDVKKYLRKVLNSVFLGLLWLVAGATAGLYFKLAYINGQPLINNLLFYFLYAVLLFFLIRWYYITWKK
ncbi:MAG TPA: hypothetical protein VLJ68_02440 [Chitinophagaceae bacterium]|nr:hypothetical protein [Chitinophagaceae bacterium]